MSERERLIELLKQNCHCKDEDCSNCNSNGICFTHRESDYLLKNGVIVPPCRLHTHIFVIPTVENSLTEITEMVVLGFSISEPYNTANCFRVRGTSALFSPAFEQFGESVFLTKEQAEKALKGGATNEN